MKSASRLFYLSVFALWAAPGSCDTTNEDCTISPKTIVGDACASYATLDRLNAKVRPAVVDLTLSTDFFSHYRLNLFNKACPFWDEANGICGNIGCAVETLENEEDIPEVWRAKELSKLEGPLAKHPGKAAQKESRPLHGELGEDVGESCVYDNDDECDERDYCVPEDESAFSKGDYVSLVKNPERFTGYGGESSRQIWDAIYRENCFQRSSFPHSANLGISQWPQGPAAMDFKHVVDAAGRQQQLQQERLVHPNALFVANTGFEADDECLEKRVFYRLVSGMHASISAHLCWDYLNKTTGNWEPNLQCYKERLHGYNDRISNLYFNFALLTRAVTKLGPFIHGNSYTFCTGDPAEDATTRAKVLKVTDRAASVPQIFDESLMFVNGEGPSLKEDFRSRFRNISRLMDCVGCDKCRLWGKVQTNGFGTALKILFELDSNSKENPILKRTELVALFNTYAKISESITFLDRFSKMAAEEKQREEAEKLYADTAKDVKGGHRDLNGQGKAPPNPDEPLSDEMVEFIRARNRGAGDASVKGQVRHELDLFLLAVRVVLTSWVRAPVVLYRLAMDELTRIFRAWIGIPNPPRWFKWEFPDVNRPDL